MNRAKMSRAQRVVAISIANRRLRRGISSAATSETHHVTTSGLAIADHLETRRLLSAAVVTQIPSQTLSDGQSSTGITLSTYLKDTALTGGTVIDMKTPVGNIPLQLTDSQTPNTVANFEKYITNGEYGPTIIQRSSPGFVLQGGGTKPDGSNNASVGTLQGEAGISNTTGTIAMALSSGPNSGTNQWFINLGDNASALDGTNDGGPFTVFGNVIDNGMTVANAIAQLSIINGSAENANWYLGSNDGLPVINYTGAFAPSTVPQANLVTDNIVTVPASQTVTYAVSSANAGLVTGSITNGVLTLSPHSASSSGSTNVTVTATDLSGGTASSTFAVNVQAAAVTLASTSTALTVSSSTVGVGASDIFTATVTSTGSSPAGTVTFTSGSTTLGTKNLSGDAATLTSTFSTTGTQSVIATYNGDSSLAASTSSAVAVQVVSTGVTVASLDASSASVAFGAADTFTATISPAVSGSVATGTVTFNSGDAVLGTADLVNNSAALTVNLNQTGAQTITATYNGDASNQPATATAVSVEVDSPSPLAATIAKASVPASGIAGQPFKGSFTLALNNSDAIAPQSGTVKVDVYATIGGVVAPDSVVIGTETHRGSYTTGKTVTITVPVKSLSSGLIAGIYTLVAQAVDTTGMLSALATGPAVTIAAPAIALSETFAKLALPVSVVAGSKTSAAAVLKITNTGNILSSGSTQIQLYASVDGTIANGTLIKSITRKLAIRPNQSVSVSIPLGSYPQVTDGNYLIVAQIIDPKMQASSVTFATPVTISAAKIDLVANSIAGPATALAGQTISITLSLSNAGNELVAGKLSILLSFSSSSTGTDPAPLATVVAQIKLQAGQTQILHLKPRIPSGAAARTMYLIADLDPDNAFNDINLSNNSVVSSSSLVLSSI